MGCVDETWRGGAATVPAHGSRTSGSPAAEAMRRDDRHLAASRRVDRLLAWGDMAETARQKCILSQCFQHVF